MPSPSPLPSLPTRLSQYEFSLKPTSLFSSSHIGYVTTPKIIGRIPYQMSPQWIKMNITRKPQSIGVFVHQNGSIMPLEEMSYSSCLCDRKHRDRLSSEVVPHGFNIKPIKPCQQCSDDTLLLVSSHRIGIHHVTRVSVDRIRGANLTIWVIHLNPYKR